MEAGYPLIQGGVRARCWREWRKFYFWDTASLINLAMQDGFHYWWGDSSGGTDKFVRLDDSQHALKYASYLGSFSIGSFWNKVATWDESWWWADIESTLWSSLRWFIISFFINWIFEVDCQRSSNFLPLLSWSFFNIWRTSPLTNLFNLLQKD